MRNQAYGALLHAISGIEVCLTGNPPQQTRDANLKALAATFRFIDQTVGKPNTTRQTKPLQAMLDFRSFSLILRN